MSAGLARQAQEKALWEAPQKEQTCSRSLPWSQEHVFLMFHLMQISLPSGLRRALLLYVAQVDFPSRNLEDVLSLACETRRCPLSPQRTQQAGGEALLLPFGKEVEENPEVATFREEVGCEVGIIDANSDLASKIFLMMSYLRA